MTMLAPKESTHTGFSMKTCLPALTAASKWNGRNPGGVARMTTFTSGRASTFWKASNPMNWRSAGTSTFTPCLFFNSLREPLRRSSNISAMATSFTLGPVTLRFWSAAPEPRPPQPIMATRYSGDGAGSWARRTGAAATAAPRVALEVEMKSRRVVMRKRMGV